LGCEAIFDAMGIPDHTNNGPSHRLNSAFIVLRKIFQVVPRFRRIMPATWRRINMIRRYFGFGAALEPQACPASLASR
jgi:hypothetical protein